MQDVLNLSSSPQGQIASGPFSPSTSCNTKFNRKASSSQAFRETNFTLDSEIEKDVISFYESLTSGGRRLFDYIWMASTRCRHIYFTQAHIGKKSKLGVRQVQRILKLLVNKGVLIMRYRHMTSCEYRFNQFFHSLHVQDMLRHLSRGAKFISIALLFPFTRYDRNELVAASYEECRTKTLDDYLYNRNRKRTILSLYTLRARVCKKPRQETMYELLESQTIFKNNGERMVQSFSSTVNRIGMLLNLTNAGKSDIVQYPEEALLHAESMWSANAHRVEDRVKWFHGMCHRYCKEKRLYIDYAYSKRMATMLGIKESDAKVNLPSKSIPEERTQSRQYNKTGNQSTLNLNGSSTSSNYQQSETLRLKKDNDNDNKIESYAEELFGHDEHSDTYYRKESGKNGYNPEKLYNPITGGYYEGNQIKSNKVRYSQGPPAPPQQAHMFLDNIMNMFEGKITKDAAIKRAEEIRDKWPDIKSS